MLLEERGRRALPVSLDAAEHVEGEVLGAAAPTPAAGAPLLMVLPTMAVPQVTKSHLLLRAVAWKRGGLFLDCKNAGRLI